MAAETHDGKMATPMGIFTLDFAFGTAPNPGGGLQYVQVGPDHWWDGDMKSPTYNTMQVCKKAQCPFNTVPHSGTENLEIPQYAHAVVMGVNKARVPGNGGAFFVHTTDGGPDRGLRRDRRRHDGEDHAVAATRRADRHRQVESNIKGATGFSLKFEALHRHGGVVGAVVAGGADLPAVAGTPVAIVVERRHRSA